MFLDLQLKWSVYHSLGFVASFYSNVCHLGPCMTIWSWRKLLRPTVFPSLPVLASEIKWECIRFVFWDRASLCSPGCPGTHCVNQAGLELPEIHCLCPPGLGLLVCTTTLSRDTFLFSNSVLTVSWFLFGLLQSPWKEIYQFSLLSILIFMMTIKAGPRNTICDFFLNNQWCP